MNTEDRNEGHDIGWAVREMRYHGGKVCRTGWNGKGMYLVFQKAYVMMRTAQGDFVPWVCSQSDLLATDWELANG